MLFVLTLGILVGIAAATLIHQWLGGTLAAEGHHSPPVFQPASFPRLAPPRRAATGYRPRRHAA